MDFVDILLRIALGSIIGFTIGLTGVGGGILAVPGIQLVLGLPPILSVGTASFYAFATQGMTAFTHWRIGNVAGRTIGWFLLGGLPITVATGLTIAQAAHIPAVQSGVTYLIVAVMIASFFLMLRGRKQTDLDADAPPPHLPVRALCCGAVAGLIIGATSIGGGILLIPMMAVGLRLPLARAIGSATVVASLTTLTTSLTYSGSGQADLFTAGIMVLGSIPAVALGARCAVRMPTKGLRYAVLGLIVIAAIAMLYRSHMSDDPACAEDDHGSADLQTEPTP